MKRPTTKKPKDVPYIIYTGSIRIRVIRFSEKTIKLLLVPIPTIEVGNLTTTQSRLKYEQFID